MLQMIEITTFPDNIWAFQTHCSRSELESVIQRHSKPSAICNIPDARDFICMDQVHGTTVLEYDPELSGSYQGDALITDRTHVVLNTHTADCVPMLIHIPAKNPWIGVIHAGTEGLMSGIIDNTFQVLSSKDLDVSKTYVYIGAHIGKCCYNMELNEERVARFRETFGSDCIHNNTCLDLISAVQKALALWDITNITFADTCTACSSNTPSHYVEGSKRTETLLYGIMLLD